MIGKFIHFAAPSLALVADPRPPADGNNRPGR